MIEPKLRCWPEGVGGETDSTAGLIELCTDWIKPDMIGSEIGCFAGVSTEVITSFCKTLYCVDPWNTAAKKGYTILSEDQLNEAETKFDLLHQSLPPGKIFKYKMYSVVGSITVPNALDFVYIDGAHDKANATIDVLLWGEKLKPGGLLMGHDFSCVHPVLKYLGLPLERVYKDDSWVIVKPK